MFEEPKNWLGKYVVVIFQFLILVGFVSFNSLCVFVSFVLGMGYINSFCWVYLSATPKTVT